MGGSTILNRLNALALLNGEEEKALTECRQKLFEVRERREKPGWDDKVLADWNGLAIRALAKAGDAMGNPEWIKLAEGAYTFVSSRMVSGDRLFHSYRAGKSKAPATSADYANMISAALALHQLRNEQRYLDDAVSWTAIMNRHYDADGGGYYFSADDTSDLFMRPLSASDDAVPNANATMLQNLADLYTLTGDTAYLKRADALLSAFQGAAQTMAIAYTGLLSGVLTLIAPHHIVIAGDRLAPGFRLGKGACQGLYSQRRRPVDWGWQRLPVSSPAAGKGAISGKITAYVCVGQHCSLPITEPDNSSKRSSKSDTRPCSVCGLGLGHFAIRHSQHR